MAFDCMKSSMMGVWTFLTFCLIWGTKVYLKMQKSMKSFHLGFWVELMNMMVELLFSTSFLDGLWLSTEVRFLGRLRCSRCKFLVWIPFGSLLWTCYFSSFCFRRIQSTWYSFPMGRGRKGTTFNWNQSQNASTI